MSYLLFIIRCIFGKFKFFTLKPLQQAHFLAHTNLLFEAGQVCMKAGYYQQAITYFKQCEAPRHLMTCYQHIGQPSEALVIAENYKLYKQGAAISMHIGNSHKAAYFYTQFDLPEAIKLYKQQGDFYHLAHCYLKDCRFSTALHTFLQCSSPTERLEGLALIEEVAIVCYLSGDYEGALRLFTTLNDPYSVLECAKKLDDPYRIEHASRALSLHLLEEDQPLEAAYHLAPYAPSLARIYLYLSQIHNPELIYAIHQSRYLDALTICFQTSHLFLAKEITKHWLSIKDTQPLQSVS